MVEWQFVEAIMAKMEFPPHWINLIQTYLHSVSYSILVNGEPQKSFLPSRGLRQGDPLSPYFFILCAEALTALLNKAEGCGVLTPIPIGRGSVSVNHLFFADDSLLFCQASTKELIHVLNLLDIYEKASGQKGWRILQNPNSLVARVLKQKYFSKMGLLKPKWGQGHLLPGEFSKEETQRTAEPFRYSIVLKFLRNQPSLDAIRAFIHKRWNLDGIPVVSNMRHPRNVFIRMVLEEDCMKAMSREVNDIDGVPYRPFHWTPEFKEEEEPYIVPVWIVLPGLPPNYYHESFLKILKAPIGRFIRSDNSTRCATRTDGARICVEMDAAKQPLPYFWIGMPGLGASRKQEIIYETLLVFCSKCKIQGHNSKTCRAGKKNAGGKVWVRQQEPIVEESKEKIPTPVVDDKEVETNQDTEENRVLGEPILLVEELEPEKDQEENPEIADPAEEMNPLMEAELETDRREGEVVPSSEEREVDNVHEEEVLLEDGSMSDPEPEKNAKVFLQEKEYHSDAEDEVVKRKYQKRQFEKIRSSRRVFMRMLRFDKVITNENDGGKIWVFWKSEVDVQMLWEELSSDRMGVEPCLFAGDFNIIRSDVERCGGRPWTRVAMDEFNRWIHQGRLMEMNSQGGKFTWCNGQQGLSGAWAKLDRVFGAFKLASKLKKLKVALREWNKRVFGRTNNQIAILEEKVESLEHLLPRDWDNDIERELVRCSNELSSWRRREDIRLAQMAKIKWRMDGDRNSKFFHVWLSNKRSNPAREVPDLTSLISSVIDEEDCVRPCGIPSLVEVKEALSSIPINSSPGPDGFGDNVEEIVEALAGGTGSGNYQIRVGLHSSTRI
ncbi:uncharacterized protein LOC118348589 [Juglans regia]|uniref:Uncharacterized protein LOC118348589 n=1 Tax=Juglans regia TaxID=51240 RepID=A0A6P9EGB6_JUGRE|nr:uncharacterized protein LOC118348589 [Juglans regia]